MSAYDDLIVSHAPALYWKLDEAFVGTNGAPIVADSSGNGRTGASQFVYSRAAIVRGSASAAELRAAFATIVHAATPAALNASPSGLSYECWVYFTSSTATLGGAFPMFMVTGATDATVGVYLFFDKGSRAFVWRCGHFGSRTLQSPSYTAIPSNRLFHLVGVQETDGTLRLYINGVLANQLVGAWSSYPAVGADFRVGNMSASSSYFYHGGLSHAAVYSHPLTAGQVLAHYRAGLVAIQGKALVNAAIPFDKVVAIDAATFTLSAAAVPDIDGNYYLPMDTPGPFYVCAIADGVRPLMHGPITPA